MQHPYPAARTRIIHTKGSDFAIGQQHGEQCGIDAAQGLPVFFNRMWQSLSNVGRKEGTWKRMAMRPGQWLVDPLLVNVLVSRLPAFARARIKGLSSSTDLTQNELLTACVLPDLLPILQSLVTKFKADRFPLVRQPNLFGCSSFIQNGERFLVGRNLDFPGVCFWDRYQVIQTTNKPGALRMIGFTTAGNPLAGITGINEAQIYLALHQHYCPKVSLAGQLPFVIGERVLESARTIDEAIKIIEQSKLCSSWAFILADGKTRQGAIVERQPGRAGVRRLVDARRTLTHSNFFQTESCRGAEYATSARMNWDNYCRNFRLKQQLEDYGPGLTPAQAVQVMSDHYDPFLRREKVSNRCIGTAHNIQSLVIDPEEMRVYLAEGDAPVQLRKYVEYDLGALLDGASQPTGAEYSGFQYSDESMGTAKEQFVLSFVEYMAGNLQMALRYARDSLLNHWAAETALIVGILLMKDRQNEDAITVLEQSRSNMKKELSLTQVKDVPPEYFDTATFLARAHFLAGNSVQGRALFAEVANDGRLEDSNIRRIASTTNSYSMAQMDRLLPPYSIYAPVE